MFLNYADHFKIKNSINEWLLSNLYFFSLIIIITVILTLVYFVSKQNRHNDVEKISAYECGFEPFSEARSPFNVHFYVVALVFLIFDLEVAFLIPWAASLGDLGLNGWYSMMIFLIIVNVGFFYEISESGLKWKTIDLD